jgi:single-stranded DNA-specific DHH superfamily exonuclease
MKVNFKQAREFLEKINEKDRVMIFTHKDLDGFAAGILFMKFCEKKKAKVEVRIIDYGVSRISDTDLSGFNKILLSDLAPGMVWEDLVKLKDKQILYTDHHQAEEKSPIPDFVLELRLTSEGYMPSSRTVYELTEKENKNLYWLSVFGVLSDMGQLHKINDGFLNEFYKTEKISYEDSNNMTEKVNDIIIYFSASLKSFNKLAELKEVKDISKLKKYYDPIEKEFERLESEFNKTKLEFNDIVYFYLESEYKMIKSPLTTGFSTKDPSKIFIFATPKTNGIISISGRNQSREYDVSLIMKDCLSGLKDGLAGGHKVAAGGQVDKSDLNKFIDRLKQIKLEKYKI